MEKYNEVLAGTPHKDLSTQLLALRWPVAVASAAVLPLALPLPGNPVTLAGFVVFIGGTVLVSSLRWLLIFLPVLAALGPYFIEMNIAGVNLFGFRLLIISLAVFATPLTSRSQWWFNPVARYTVLFMIFWVVWGFLSLLWTPDPASGLVDVLTVVFGLGLLLALFNLRCHTPRNMDMLRFGWVFAFLAVMAQAAWELLTGDRLPSHKTEANPEFMADSSLIQATLGSPAGFGSFLLLTTPFLMWSMERARRLEKLIYLGLLAATGFFALYSGARNSFFALALQFAMYFFILERRWYVRCAAVACGLVAAALWINVFLQSDFMLAQKYERAAQLGYEEGSIHQRILLTVNGIGMAVETLGRGAGAAGYEETLASGDVLVPLRVERRGVLKPAHNVWAEILAEYGVLVFVGLMGLLAWIARLGWQARRCTLGGREGGPGTVARVVLVALVGYAFYGIQAGSVLTASTTWMLLATLAVLAAFLHEKSRPPRQSALPSLKEPYAPTRGTWAGEGPEHNKTRDERLRHTAAAITPLHAG